jgi:hypothetical protein
MDRWSQNRAADRRRGRTYLAARRRGHRPWPSLRLVLAGELKRTGGDHRRAFDTYQTRLASIYPRQATRCGTVHFVLRHPDPIRPVVPQPMRAMNSARWPPCWPAACATTSSCPTTASSSWNTRPRRKPYGESRRSGSTRRRIVPRWSRGARARHRGSGRMHGLRRRRQRYGAARRRVPGGLGPGGDSVRW